MNRLLLKNMIWLLCTVPAVAAGQEKQITIDQCFEWARSNYPLLKKQDLITRAAAYSVDNAGKSYLPTLTITGQASYQSETINFPDALGAIPGISFPSLSKDQYRAQAEISQQLYDAGITKHQKEIIRANADAQQQSLEVNMYALKERVAQLYFSILLIGNQLAQNETRKSVLQTAADKASASLQNGTAFKSNVDELQAETAAADMQSMEYRANRLAYLQVLAAFTGKTFDTGTVLLAPAPQLNTPEINRPERTLFSLQKKIYDAQEKQLQSEHLPRVNIFLDGAYGRPTLNIIDNKFGPWWLGGLRLNWSLGSLYTIKNNKNILRNNRTALDIDRETFEYNTRLVLGQQTSETKKYAELIRQDDVIIALRTSVTKSAQAQLDNGVITVHEYITKLDAENIARQTRILHNTQLLQAQYNFKITSGN